MYIHKCKKCNGTGQYRWVNGAATQAMASCHYCDGTGVRELTISPAQKAYQKASATKRQVKDCLKYRVVELPEKAYDPYDYDI